MYTCTVIWYSVRVCGTDQAACCIVSFSVCFILVMLSLHSLLFNCYQFFSVLHVMSLPEG